MDVQIFDVWMCRCWELCHRFMDLKRIESPAAQSCVFLYAGFRDYYDKVMIAGADDDNVMVDAK